jgi:hypothetical protein
MSLTRVAGTRSSIASRFAVNPRGLRKSSRSVSRGWTGGMILLFLAIFVAPLVIVHNLYIQSVGFDPAKAYPPLVVDPNAVLPESVTPKCFEAVSWNCSKVGKGNSSMYLIQFPFPHNSNSL